jgi:hypothetical protein
MLDPTLILDPFLPRVVSESRQRLICWNNSDRFHVTQANTIGVRHPYLAMIAEQRAMK